MYRKTCFDLLQKFSSEKIKIHFLAIGFQTRFNVLIYDEESEAIFLLCKF